MRVLLDEMYPHSIAAELRRRDHDASAVTERPELRTTPDPDLFATAQRERRAIVTENVRDFVVIATERAHRGEEHFGLILVDPGKYPRGSPRTPGRMVTRLDKLLADHPGAEPTSLVLWL